jgi:hypothetical protein
MVRRMVTVVAWFTAAQPEAGAPLLAACPLALALDDAALDDVVLVLAGAPADEATAEPHPASAAHSTAAATDPRTPQSPRSPRTWRRVIMLL